MRAPTAPALLLAALCALPAVAARPRETSAPRIEGLEALREPGSVRVSYRLANLLPEEALDRIHSGIAVRFRHRIEVVEKRPGLFVGDRVHARALLELEAAYDSLTQRYELVRTVELRGRQRDGAEPQERRETVDSEQDMRRWLTEIGDLRLPLPDDPPAAEPSLTVRVEVVLGRRWILLVIPSSESVGAEAELAGGD